MMMTTKLGFFLCALLASVHLTSGFGTRSNASASSALAVSKVAERTVISSTSLHLFDSEQEQSGMVGDGGDDVTFDSSELYKSLNNRKIELEKGVGKV